MGKTKIDWCDWVWNPAWGCLHDCSWCYARKMAKRFAYQIAKKENELTKKEFDILEVALNNFKPTWLESNFVRSFPKKPSRIFVNSMSDIAFWKPEWFKRVIIKSNQHPQHTFMFLTKAPKIYNKYHFPSNCWLGVTVTKTEDINKSRQLEKQKGNNLTFLSFEPILSDHVHGFYFDHDWLILGLETGRKDIFIPKLGNLNVIVDTCRHFHIPIFMKESMKKIWKGELIQEFPE